MNKQMKKPVRSEIVLTSLHKDTIDELVANVGLHSVLRYLNQVSLKHCNASLPFTVEEALAG